MKNIVHICLAITAFLPLLNGMDETVSRRIRYTEEQKRIMEIRQMEDQSAIAEFVKNDPSDSVSLTALRLINDQTLRIYNFLPRIIITILWG